VSLNIDVDNVDAVLLADGWHAVHAKTFDLDAYEYHYGGHVVFYGGQVKLVPSTGFAFKERLEDGRVVTTYGPLTAILAVRQGGGE
jgi:hypothetical protein